MALNLNPGNYPDEQRPTPTDVLDAVSKHVPLTIVVELVESRYRDRRNRFFAAVLGSVLTLVVGSGAVAFQIYTINEARAREAAKEQREVAEQQRVERETTERRARYRQELERTETRLQFARTLQSFQTENIEDDELALDRQLHVSLDPGERKKFSVALVNGGPYSIRVDDKQHPPGMELTTTNPLPLTPVMYLYRLGRGIVNPVKASATVSLPFTYEDEGTYFLEVEELLREPVEFTLTVERGRSSQP